MKINYDIYKFGKIELLRYLILCLGLCAGIDYLFYKNIWLMALSLPACIVFLRFKKKSLIRRRRKQLNYQFKDALNGLSVALQAGYSVENAIKACYTDLGRLYAKDADIMQELSYIISQLNVSVSLESLFLDLGERTGLEDIENFASVFYTARRTGGDMDQIVQKVSMMLGDKIDVKKEIEATLSAKKSEQMIMSIMPAAIILYMQLTSPGFMDVLYGNVLGMVCMTICLAIYILAYYLGMRIVDIEV